jgi:hypothetical protein
MCVQYKKQIDKKAQNVTQIPRMQCIAICKMSIERYFAGQVLIGQFAKTYCYRAVSFFFFFLRNYLKSSVAFPMQLITMKL